jgi:hypothetical protein
MADLGLKTLCPDEAHVAGAAVGVDIVFVHGLRGGRESTWKKEKVLWPQDLLPKDIKQARILTVVPKSSCSQRLLADSYTGS